MATRFLNFLASRGMAGWGWQAQENDTMKCCADLFIYEFMMVFFFHREDIRSHGLEWKSHIAQLSCWYGYVWHFFLGLNILLLPNNQRADYKNQWNKLIRRRQKNRIECLTCSLNTLAHDCHCNSLFFVFLWTDILGSWDLRPINRRTPCIFQMYQLHEFE